MDSVLNSFVLFSMVMAGLGVVYCLYWLFIITLAAWAESPVERIKRQLLGREWPSRWPYVIGLLVCVTWLWSFWPLGGES